MEKYEINRDTAAVVGVSEKFTKIVEKDQDYFFSDAVYEVMDYSCQYFGSSYSGRVNGCKKMLGVNYKVPIIVEESNNLIFFPISSTENPGCIWIALNWYDYVTEEDGITYIYLKNGKRISTKVSKYSIENQIITFFNYNWYLIINT